MDLFRSIPRLAFLIGLTCAVGCTPPSDESADAEDASSLDGDLESDRGIDPMTDGAGDSQRDSRGEGGDAETRGEASWKPAPPLAGGPRQEHATLVLDGKLYVIGGFDADRSMLASVEVYDPRAESWSTATIFPEPLHHANAAVVGDTIWVLGYLVSGFRERGATYAYDPATGDWEERAPMPSSRARGASAVGAIDGKIYVAGGLRNGSAVRHTSVYDPKADTWSSLPDAPRALDHAASAAVDGRLVIAGGRDTAISKHTARVDIFDPSDSSWSSGSPMATSRAGTASAVWNGRLYVIGGEGHDDDPNGVFPHTAAYDVSGDRWRTLPEMAHPRHGMDAGVIEGVVYVPGGADSRGFGAVDTHSRLDLDQLDVR